MNLIPSPTTLKNVVVWLFNTWLSPTISQERLQWQIYWHQLLQTKQNDNFELYVTIDHFYKANATLPTKTPTDFI